jgi:hypothetical protein
MVTKYRITTSLGKSFEGFIREEGAGVLLHHVVYANAYRALSSTQTYDTPNPKYDIRYSELVAKVMVFDNIVPIEYLEEDSLPYALVEQGSWWQKVMVEYEEVLELR